jgi:hypothetical protein
MSGWFDKFFSSVLGFSFSNEYFFFLKKKNEKCFDGATFEEKYVLCVIHICVAEF